MRAWVRGGQRETSKGVHARPCAVDEDGDEVGNRTANRQLRAISPESRRPFENDSPNVIAFATSSQPGT